MELVYTAIVELLNTAPPWTILVVVMLWAIVSIYQMYTEGAKYKSLVKINEVTLSNMQDTLNQINLSIVKVTTMFEMFIRTRRNSDDD